MVDLRARGCNTSAKFEECGLRDALKPVGVGRDERFGEVT